MSDQSAAKPVELTFEQRVAAILKLLLDHAGIAEDAVVKHLQDLANIAKE